ncbi:DUF2490 domain-containing protein [Abyssalbus ytuae]|uniref:DUF2490 domain-containing protein n=1 Tax=Abyssalbus ytuae TaxID=2926907 RepID=A0A9E7D263_9FLAO|nr:DUF2490 domain-containing protein [Abyssalbus ytuae]UOB17828.1 DUF2490 domain-containing protein [Abyssalbus ytuae]
MKKPIVLLLTLFSSFIFSQTKPDSHIGSLNAYFGNHKFADSWSILTYAELVHYDFFAKDYNRTIVDLGINYHLNDKFTLSLAGRYMDFGSFEDNAPSLLYEKRFYEQLLYKFNIGKLKVLNRFRLIQHWSKRVNTDINHFNRFRYRLHLLYPLYNKWFLTFQNEIFLNLKDEMFNRDRILGGIGYKFNKKISLQAGYTVDLYEKKKLQNIQLMLILHTDLRKKEKEQ